MSLLFSSSICAQNDKLFKNFGIDNPISYQFVMTIAQDSQGFMWFGAQEGLHRFDGHQLVSHYHDPGVKNSLSSNVISRILTDKRNRLWVGTRGGGLNLYRNSNQDFIHITSKSTQNPISDDTVNILFEDSTGNLWIGTDNGLNILSESKGEIKTTQIFQELGNPNSLSHNTIHAITETNDNQIWVGTNGGGISVFDLQGNFIKSIKFGDSNKSNYINKFINTLYVDTSGNIWIGTVDRGLLKYNQVIDEYVHYQFNSLESDVISSNVINSIYQDSKENIWIATDNGLSIYNFNKDAFTLFNHAPNNPYSLSNDYIITFYEDKNKMMWIGTFTGVNRWDPTMTTFAQYTGKNSPNLASRNITSFVQPDKEYTIFSTYSGGIYKLIHKQNVIKRIDLNNFFSDLRIMTLFADKDTLWVGTRASGLYRINLHNNEITSYKHDEKITSSISANSITDIIKDQAGLIWVSTFYQGLNRLNKDGSFTRFNKNKLRPEKGPSNNYILHLLEDEQGIIWIATYGGGINRFDPNLESFVHIQNNRENLNSISSDLAWYLLIDNNGDLWSSTQAAGLNILSYENRLKGNYDFAHLNTKDGMKSQTVYSMVQDENNDIWLSSNKGVSRYSPKRKSFKHFDLSHGLVDLDYNHGAIFKGLDNIVYFGAGTGFSTVKPENSNIYLKAPEVRLTDIFKLNEPIVFDNYFTDQSLLELEYTDQLISFEYVGLNYENPDSTSYKYRLLGFDNEWIDAGKSRRVSYTNLPSGEYQLQIIAGNNDNIWSDPGLSLDIIVKPAPWNTWWAYLLYAVSLALLLLSYSRFLNRKLLIEQQQKTYLKQQIQEKTQEFKLKNIELEQANQQLEDAATVDKVTGVKSRRYLDIYIEQASQLMTQIHENILPVQRSLLPRLYFVMVKLENIEKVTNSQLVNLTDLLLYSRNPDDLVIRWANDTFAIIGFEKDNNARDLVNRLSNRFEQALGTNIAAGMAYSFYPFNFEQPMALSWDQVSVITEHALKVGKNNKISWLGFYAPKVQPFNYLDVIQQHDVDALSKLVKLKQS